MAERIVSPGVFTRENDLSFLAQGIGEIGAAFIGPFKQGPAFVPTIVRTQSEFEQMFGTPDGTYYTDYAVQNYLREAGVATVIRVMDTTGYSQVAPIGLTVSSSLGQKLVTTLNSTANGDDETGFGLYEIIQGGASGSFMVSGSGVDWISSSIKPVSDGKTSQCPNGHQLVTPHRRFWTTGYTQLSLRKAGFAIILLRAVLRKLTTAKPKAL